MLTDEALMGSFCIFPFSHQTVHFILLQCYDSHGVRTQFHSYYLSQVYAPTGMCFLHQEEFSLLIAENFFLKFPGSRIFILVWKHKHSSGFFLCVWSQSKFLEVRSCAFPLLCYGQIVEVSHYRLCTWHHLYRSDRPFHLVTVCVSEDKLNLFC